MSIRTETVFYKTGIRKGYLVNVIAYYNIVILKEGAIALYSAFLKISPEHGIEILCLSGLFVCFVKFFLPIYIQLGIKFNLILKKMS